MNLTYTHSIILNCRRIEKHLQSILAVLNEHLLFILSISIFVLSAFITSVFFIDNVELKFSLYNEVMFSSGLLFFFIVVIRRCISIFIHDRPKHPIPYLFKDIYKNYLSVKNLTVLFIFIIFFPTFASAFTYYKSLIPVINNYHWDPYLAAFDRFLHFGIDPWRILQVLFHSYYSTKIINIFYNIWMFYWFFYLYYVLFILENESIRMQFLLSFIFSWIIIGVLFATIFSSVGPCFYSRLYDNDYHFKELMLYLNDANANISVWAVNTQNNLWKNYKDMSIVAGSGISAMPSMHVSITCLIALCQLKINRKVGMLCFIYLIIIFIGSIHLGWHYAIDGYFSVFVTVLIWWVIGKCLSKKM